MVEYDWQYPAGIDRVDPFMFGISVHQKGLLGDKLVIEFRKKQELFLDKRDQNLWDFYKHFFSVSLSGVPVEVKAQLVCHRPDLVKSTLRQYGLMDKVCFKPTAIETRI